VTAIAVEVAGAWLLADPSGALWWPERDTLVVADLHLEKARSLARRGRGLLPPYDSAATLARLARVVARYEPKTVVALGDSFHCGRSAAGLGEEERAALAALAEGRRWLWIAGNHDPEPNGLSGECLPDWRAGPLLFRHEPAPGPAPGEIAGHLHPAARVLLKGRTFRRRCFATDGERMILPAFGALAGGLNVLDGAYGGMFGEGRLAALLLGEARTYAVGWGRLVGE